MGLPEEDQRRILHDNAVRVLGLKSPEKEKQAA
jgi:predicted TIM-barrel fold metal-dependent hydrolase